MKWYQQILILIVIFAFIFIASSGELRLIPGKMTKTTLSSTDSTASETVTIWMNTENNERGRRYKMDDIDLFIYTDSFGACADDGTESLYVHMRPVFRYNHPINDTTRMANIVVDTVQISTTNTFHRFDLDSLITLSANQHALDITFGVLNCDSFYVYNQLQVVISE